MVVEIGDLNYCGKDPGAVKFGNFINYYSFHNSKQRLESLHPLMFNSMNKNANEEIICLDIGCNTGELTKKVHEYLKNVIYPKSTIKILGIDIDPVLIERANEHINSCDISFRKVDIMNIKEKRILQEFLNSHNRKKFDILFCFSVTMWIHLNNGDEKFIEFLKYTIGYARVIIIEPQPWKCYRNAQRRIKKSGSNFPLYDSLNIRNNVETVIEDTFISNGLTKVYESPSSQWNRKIQSFHLLLQ